ncbi:hypothetical protein B0H14DRAFT_3631240 [Mycena olivaceomarginata]|nr:hypothetical protein B0H14DRAFT_3631240 [Mycena olivaceomarginata]
MSYARDRVCRDAVIIAADSVAMPRLSAAHGGAAWQAALTNGLNTVSSDPAKIQRTPKQTIEHLNQVLFVRGALEVPPIGLVAAPPLGPLQAALLARLTPLGKTLSFTGVNYIASFAGLITGGSATGAAAMAVQLTDIANSYPSASLVTAGYDEGGQLVHDSAKLLTAPVAARLKLQSFS